MTYREYIENLKNKYIGKNVTYNGNQYKVIDVDYNGGILINKPHYYTESYMAETTAVSETMIKIID